MTDDLRGGQVEDWLVTGWFTPDYRPLAEAFAANLTQHGAPYHLWAKQKLESGWSTRQKPSVVLETLDAYPGKAVVLMDVDCVIRGDISPVAAIDGDVGATLIARNMMRRRRPAHWIAAECSSRVVVFRDTEGARAFARKWAATIEQSRVNHDEHSMVWAMLSSLSTTRFDYVDQLYSGREIGKLPDAVIVHDSAHDEQRRAARGRIKTALREFERRFLRTGLSSRARLKGEMSVVLGGER